MTPTTDQRLIESDRFPIEFLSRVALRESWRKEVHRPIYHVHKWWAKRLGSVFRGALLGCVMPDSEHDLPGAFFKPGSFPGVVFDPFMGSGTTIGEAHKLGLAALGRDINPVAVRAVRTALGPMDEQRLRAAMERLAANVGPRLRELYRTEDRDGRDCEALYFFWVMQIPCPACREALDLFPSRIIAANAYPGRRPLAQVVCPGCGEVFPQSHAAKVSDCPACSVRFDPHAPTASGSTATCSKCGERFRILAAKARHAGPPDYRLYAKLVLSEDGSKSYLRASSSDLARFSQAALELAQAQRDGQIPLPDLPLLDGHNTRQAMGYGFVNWRQFFNPRQLLALGSLRKAIVELEDVESREVLLTLFSGLLEFNNLFTSYKGEGTGAVRHMFSHHILKPERTPIEANAWGTPKSSGSFTGLFTTRVLRASGYRVAPTEVALSGSPRQISARPFRGLVSPWPAEGPIEQGHIYLSCGDSRETGLADQSIDYVVTDPPFFDNVHYSELADFFYAWQQLDNGHSGSTRALGEVQDVDPERFSGKLAGVFSECHRILRDDGLLVFSYHHSRDEGWESLASAIYASGFGVVNVQPVRAEMSVAAPKSQAKSPIQLDVLIVCRKGPFAAQSPEAALAAAAAKADRLERAGFTLSSNDCRVIYIGHLLTAAESAGEFVSLRPLADQALSGRLAAPAAQRDADGATSVNLALFTAHESG